MESKRYFLYCESANIADARALLSKFGINYDEADSIQAGVKELSFITNRDREESIKSEILNSQVKVFFSDSKLPITGSLGTITASISASDIKVGSTDQTSTNAKYLKTNSNGEVFVAPPNGALCGQKSTTDANAIALSATSVECNGQLEIQAKASNGANVVLVGNATDQTIELYAGQSIPVPTDDLSKVYIKRDGATNVGVNWIGGAR